MFIVQKRYISTHTHNTFVLLDKYHYDYEIKEVYMGGLEEMHTSLWWEDLLGGSPDAGIDGRLILEWLL